MNGYTVFLLVLFLFSLIGGYLATGKKSRELEELGHHLVWLPGFIGILGICLPTVTFTAVEVFGVVVATVELLQVVVAVVGGSLFGVSLWRDKPAVNGKQPEEQPG